MNDNANSIDKKENIFYSVTKKLPKYNIIFKKIFIRFITLLKINSLNNPNPV